jgi:hypothetical protein
MRIKLWKEIPGFDGKYMASNRGEIYSIKSDRILKTFKNVKRHRTEIKISHNGVSKCYKVHRLVASAFIKDWDKYECIDHIDNNPYNNNVKNLRGATLSQNQHNKSSARKTSSKYKGVYKLSSGNKWGANIRINGKTIYLGSATTEKGAAKLYNRAAKREHNRFFNQTGA